VRLGVLAIPTFALRLPPAEVQGALQGGLQEVIGLALLPFHLALRCVFFYFFTRDCLGQSLFVERRFIQRRWDQRFSDARQASDSGGLGLASLRRRGPRELARFVWGYTLLRFADAHLSINTNYRPTAYG